MTSPELSLTAKPLRKRFLDLAATIIRQEVRAIEPRGGTGLVFSWKPLNQESFLFPIALNRVSLTLPPYDNARFTVVASEFEILGDEAMRLQVDSQMDEDKFPDDDWNKMVFEMITTSYKNHVHSSCEANFPSEAPVVTGPGESFKILDKRVR